MNNTEDLILNADVVMKSLVFGESSNSEKKANRKRIPVISEIEFAAFSQKPSRCRTTGSNGKTTTTMLVHLY
jgi:UDP-N-acetylmuramoylalanine--D-glutamate ligase